MPSGPKHAREAAVDHRHFDDDPCEHRRPGYGDRGVLALETDQNADGERDGKTIEDIGLSQCLIGDAEVLR